jgi:LmbE family N-acetylglucosaminyl deacetylase
VTALVRTTDLGVGAHPDDLEIMTAGPIVECRAQPDRWFAGVVCTDGRRSPRGGRFAEVGDEELAQIRREEQARAAELGGYLALVQLGYRTEAVLEDVQPLVDDLLHILEAAQPVTVYTHEPGDSHRTHVVVCEAVVAACRRLAPTARPRHLVGCEGWRGLDRLPETERADLEWHADDAFERALIAAHASQVEGGPVDVDAELAKRRTEGRRHRTRAVDLTALLAG